MDFTYTADQLAFRDEIRDFLAAELPPEGTGGWAEADESAREVAIGFARKLAARGWLMPDWQKEYGGAGLGPIESLVFHEEMAYAEAPDAMGGEVGYIGPSIFTFGNDEQKAQFLPGIASATEFWCQLYSEPGSGSDLASLRTAAVSDGDEYVLNGGKVWTSNAHNSHHGMILARTDPDAPKHKGLSLFLIDMDLPGITISPLINMAGMKGFNQVLFDNVRVPRRALLGEENAGWKEAMGSLDFERSAVVAPARSRRLLERMVAALEASDPERRRATLWSKLATLACDIQAARLFTYRVASMEARGIFPNYEASVAKLYGSELDQRLAQVGVELEGLYGQTWSRRNGWCPGQEQLLTVASTIASGSSEVQRNIIATRGLGLPRG